jgi:hypothetical protein
VLIMNIPSVVDEVPKTARTNVERMDAVSLQSSVVREVRKIGAWPLSNAKRHLPLHRLGLRGESSVAITP